MLIFGIILLAIAVTFLILFLVLEEDGSDSHFGIGVLWGWFVIVGIVLIVAASEKKQPQKFSTKDYAVKPQIDISIIDGCIQSQDTTYIFTPK